MTLLLQFGSSVISPYALISLYRTMTQARIANHPYALIAFQNSETARKVVESPDAGNERESVVATLHSFSHPERLSVTYRDATTDI